MSLYVFNVGSRQCIFVYPQDNSGDCALIDCGCDERVIEFIKRYLPKNSNGKPYLKNLTLTNYDEDHFCAICNLCNNVEIETVCFSKNLTSDEIRNKKTESKIEETGALKRLLKIKDDYTDPVNWNPPYKKYTYSLNKSDFESWTTNNLSQMVFLEYRGFRVCIPGDLEKKGWEKILQKEEEVKNMLESTNLFVASHHGRENGYYPKVFEHCKPECIIISDDSVQWETQEHMSSVYAKHVNDGISFDRKNRKVLTTRNDGNLLITIDINVSYAKLIR